MFPWLLCIKFAWGPVIFLFVPANDGVYVPVNDGVHVPVNDGVHVPVNDGVHALHPATGFADAVVCLPAPLCDIVRAALHAFDYCGIAFGGVVANGVSDTVQGDCF